MSAERDKNYLAATEKNCYFFKRFESDVQIIFDKVSFSKNRSYVKVKQLIKKGNIYLKADYFIPLKSCDTFELNCDELLHGLRDIKYLLEVDVDSNFNLTFCFQRPLVYRSVLEEVIKYNNNYGMTEKNNSVLVLVYEEESNSFTRMRNNLLAKHIITILSMNKARVYHNEPALFLEQELQNVTHVTCSEKCSLDEICIQVKQKLSISEWRKESEIEDNICLDAKIYLEKNQLMEKYGKDIHNIVISNENKSNALRKVSSLKHLLNNHVIESPDVIIHISSHGINRSVWKIGILLQILEKPNASQSYIFNQSVKVCNINDQSFDDYVLLHKNGIEKAMAHKYDVEISQDKVWSSRIDSLVDSVVKFDFLKLNPNMSLKLDLSNCHSTEKNAGIFVQYNFARLSNLFKKFEQKVEEGYYEPLLPLEEVDFSLLRLEEEWNLFQYVVSFPKLIERILDSLLSESNLKTRYPLNGICIMLAELCHYLSLYYSKIRILAGSQKHLQRLMNARLWLLKGIYRVILNSFVLLNIQGLDQM